MSYKTPLNISINVKDFPYNAKGNGITDDTAAFRAAEQAAFNTLKLVTVNGGELDSGVEIYVPSGVYNITDEILLRDWIALRGDHNAALKTSSNITILRIGGYRNRIDNIAFIGGKHHITAYGHWSGGGAVGSPVAGGPNDFYNCHFNGASGPSFYIDTTLVGDGGSYEPGRSESSASFEFEHCEIIGPVAYYGCADGVHYKNCYISWDLSGGAVNDDDGYALGFFNSGDHLFIESCLMVPNTIAGSFAWMQGWGVFQAFDCRFGGESNYVLMRVRQNMPYNGMPLHRGWITTEIEIEGGCEVTGTSNQNLIEIYDAVPRSIILRHGVATRAFGVTEEYFGNRGVWFDANTIKLNTIQDLDPQTLSILIEPLSLVPLWQHSTNPANGPYFTGDGATDVLPYIRRCINNYQADESLTLRNNLWWVGFSDASSWNISGGASVTSNSDTTTGYAIRGVFVTGGDGYNATSFLNDAQRWGYAVAQSGEYTFSIYAKSDFGGVITMGYTLLSGIDARYMRRQPMPNGVWKRISYTFWHDGNIVFPASTALAVGDFVVPTVNNFFYYKVVAVTGDAKTGGSDPVWTTIIGQTVVSNNVTFECWNALKSMFISINGMPNGSTVFWGLPQINLGPDLSSFVYPVDVPSAPTTNLTISDIVRPKYYGLRIPTVGTYRQGDIVWNISPGPGEPAFWQCVFGGSPGFWNAVGGVQWTPANLDTALIGWWKTTKGVLNPGTNNLIWQDQSGNGFDLSVDTGGGATFPSYSLTGGPLNGPRFGVGISTQQLRSATFPQLSQPFYYVVVARANTSMPGYAPHLIDMNNNNNNTLAQRNGTDSMTIYDGSFGGSDQAITINQFFLVEAGFNGASSFLAIDGGVGATQNPGSTNPVGPGISIGNGWTLFNQWLGDIIEVFVVNRFLTNSERNNLHTYCQTIYDTP